jgi:CarD family transcriptional regulator
MFKVNDVILYGTQGVCRIADIEEKSISGTKREYFVLKPVRDQGSTIYAPTDNTHVLQKMRRLLTADEINQLIYSMPDEKTEWISNVNDRKEVYKQILAGGNHLELIQMIKSQMLQLLP